MGTVAAPQWVQCVFEGSIPNLDAEIRRRPYHRNCGCALHQSRRLPMDVPCNNANHVSYPLRRSWVPMIIASPPLSEGLAPSHPSDFD